MKRWNSLLKEALCRWKHNFKSEAMDKLNLILRFVFVFFVFQSFEIGVHKRDKIIKKKIKDYRCYESEL